MNGSGRWGLALRRTAACGVRVRGLAAASALLLLFAASASAQDGGPQDGGPRLAPAGTAIPGEKAIMLSSRARVRGAADVEALLADLVAFDTFHRSGTANRDHPSFQAMTAYLKDWCEAAGLGFADHGSVVVVTLGAGSDRLGLVTHGDVQPADAGKWAADPFTLDVTSEPGRLVGRGVEDDKGPIACALVAMRELRRIGWPLRRRVELIVSYTEESDWAPFQEFLARNPPPPLNVAFDAEYPVVTAEKGWCSVTVGIAGPEAAGAEGDAELVAFTGGFFLSQVPEDAVATIVGADDALVDALRAAADADEEATFTFEDDGVDEGGRPRLLVRARGLSAHSSKPEQGVNAITHLAALLATHDWPDSRAARMARFVDERLGTGRLAERFGDVAYEDPFMGPLTLSLGTLREDGERLVAGINLRRPEGRTREEVEASVRWAVEGWSAERGLADAVTLEQSIGDPHRVHDAPHVEVLLQTFRHHTGITDAAPLSIGGGTHARLVPNGVNFGPSMPGEPYTGHSEHEFVTREQLLDNLEMVTSLLVDLAVK